MIWGLGGLIWYELLGRNDRERFPDTPWQILKRLDWDSAFFLMGVFVLVGALVEKGWIDLFADWLKSVLGANLLVSYTAIIFLSMLVSAFVDNIPYLMAMIPLVMKLAAPGAGQEALLFGLLIAASLGGEYYAHRSIGEYCWCRAVAPARAYSGLSGVWENWAAVHARGDDPRSDLSVCALGDLLGHFSVK